MRKLITWIIRITLTLVLAAAAVGLWKREEITRLLAVNSLFDADRIVENFSNMDRAFLHLEMPRGAGPVSQLPQGSDLSLPKGFEPWVKARNVTSVLVLKDGSITHESYFQGAQATDLRISWSVAKSYMSTLLGILLEEGAIASLNDPVIQYAPSLKGGAYDKASVLDVLQMSSGVTFDEDYLDYDSDINRMGRVLALGGKMDDFAASLTDSFAAPGEVWKYTSIDTHVLGMILRGATGRSVPDLMQEKLIEPMGLEQSPYILTDGIGVGFVLGGLNLTTRDYARFGQMVLQNGHWNGRQIVPEAWIKQSILPSAKTKPGKIGYGYHWWVPKGAVPGQEVMARGIYGQYIYIDIRSGVVVVTTGADRQFREQGVSDMNVAMLRALAQQAGEL